jgi:hypothetical protein
MSVGTKDPRHGGMLDGVPPDTRVVIADVPWKFYDRFSRSVREGISCRVAFDGKDIEIMTLGPLHEMYRARLDAFVAIIAEELGIKNQPLGSTTWKCKKLNCGVEPDSCYYFDEDKLLSIEQLDTSGAYVAVDRSRFFCLFVPKTSRGGSSVQIRATRQRGSTDCANESGPSSFDHSLT